MTKIAVHMHVYYVEMLDYLLDKLQNVSDADIFVTMVEQNDQAVAKIKSSFPQATIWFVENRGYDVGPFIYFLGQINLSDYEYILKLHTKSSKGKEITRLDKGFISRKYWTDLLLRALVDTPEVCSKNVEFLDTTPKVGMIGGYHLVDSARRSLFDYGDSIKKELVKMGLPKLSKIKFVAGTIFMVRSSLMQVVKDNYKLEDFAITNGSVKDGDLAHLIERILGAVVIAQGYKVWGVNRNIAFDVNSGWQKIKRFLYQKKMNRKNQTIVKICKIMIYRK